MARRMVARREAAERWPTERSAAERMVGSSRMGRCPVAHLHPAPWALDCQGPGPYRQGPSQLGLVCHPQSRNPCQVRTDPQRVADQMTHLAAMAMAIAAGVPGVEVQTRRLFVRGLPRFPWLFPMQPMRERILL